MKNISVILFLLLFPTSEAFAGSPGLYLAEGIMALTNSSQQGGAGPSGSTLLTQTDFFYDWGGYGFGVFLQYDKQGSSETDLNLGPKIELGAGPFYVEGGYAVLSRRAYTDRSIARQTGNGWALGVGVRVPLGASQQGVSGPFLQFSYKYRIMKITKQDDAPLSDAITQKDGYPLFGIGCRF